MSLSFNALSSLRHVPGFPQFSASALLLGTGASFAVPYMPLFARNEAHMSPLLLGIFMTLMSLSGVLISTQLARWSDGRIGSKPIVLTALLGAAIGYVLLCTTHSFVPLVLIACVFLGTGAAAFPQLFAFARTHFSLAGEEAADRSMITLRSMFSVAWMLGPAAAAIILGAAGFRGLFLATAACYLLVSLPLALARSRPVSQAPAVSETAEDGSGPRRPLALVALCFVLYGMSNTMGFIALPLHVTGALHEPSSTVGWLIGLCAFLEIPFILGFALFSGRFSNERLIHLSLGLFMVYFVVMAVAPSVWLLAAAQLIRAAVIAVTTTLGMAYFQELMPNRTGTALTLYANTNSVGAVLSGIVSGAFAQAFGYQAVFLLCAALTGAAFLLLSVITRPQSPGPSSGLMAPVQASK
ncbi:sugar efflux transporter [Deinococcus humi]|uniref:SET family sugar efflux transporter-like MFS transporter n=1 Tax=Deinococcus humi TaxID=662880 RepID=A0A7W8JZ61_9DEIO|nr:SET family sugar efflux transporter-like MFS transporter [Deinococcus humi]GGO38769.1 putative sugar efflux transporter [Deinococcus humi]